MAVRTARSGAPSPTPLPTAHLTRGVEKHPASTALSYLAVTNLELLKVLPWTTRRYDSLPTPGVLMLTFFTTFFEDIPQLVLQLLYVFVVQGPQLGEEWYDQPIALDHPLGLLHLVPRLPQDHHHHVPRRAAQGGRAAAGEHGLAAPAASGAPARRRAVSSGVAPPLSRDAPSPVPRSRGAGGGRSRRDRRQVPLRSDHHGEEKPSRSWREAGGRGGAAEGWASRSGRSVPPPTPKPASPEKHKLEKRRKKSVSFSADDAVAAFTATAAAAAAARQPRKATSHTAGRRFTGGKGAGLHRKESQPAASVAELERFAAQHRLLGDHALGGGLLPEEAESLRSHPASLAS